LSAAAFAPGLFITDGLTIGGGGKGKNRNQVKRLHNYIIALVDIET